MAELQESVRQNGLLQPVVVRPRLGGRFELIAGERRWRVVQLLGWETVSVVIRVVDDITAHLLGQIENDAREDVSAWERALGYVELRAHIELERGSPPPLAELRSDPDDPAPGGARPRAGGAQEPVPLAVEASCGTILFLPARLSQPERSAVDALRTVVGMESVPP